MGPAKNLIHRYIPYIGKYLAPKITVPTLLSAIEAKTNSIAEVIGGEGEQGDSKLKVVKRELSLGATANKIERAFVPYVETSSPFQLKSKTWSWSDSICGMLKKAKQWLAVANHVASAVAHLIGDMAHRAKKGGEIFVNFNYRALLLDSTVNTSELRDHVARFHGFYARPRGSLETNPLDTQQLKMANELLEKEGDLMKIKLRKLIAKSELQGATRDDWKRSQWEAFDRVNLELTREYYKSLNYIFNSRYLNDAQEQFKDRFSVDYKESLIAQTLSLTLAYNDGIDGKEIELPVKQRNGSYSLESYTIKRRNAGKSLAYFELTPKNASAEGSPWIVFRGTVTHDKKDKKGEELRLGAQESIVADLIDPEAVGNGVISNELVKKGNGNEPSLIELLQQAQDSGKPFKLTGHSLGGRLASDLAVYMKGFVDKTYTFMAPWAGETVAASWKQQLGDEGENTKIINFCIERDIVPGVGKKPVGLSIAVTPPAEPLILPSFVLRYDPLYQHGRNMLSEGSFKAQEIDEEAECKKRSRAIGETVRALAGRFRVLKPSQPQWWIKRFENQRELKKLLAQLMQKKSFVCQ